MPERQGVGEGGEAKGLHKSAQNAPTWLPRTTIPWQIKTTHTNTQNSNLLANKIQPANTLKNAQPAFISKEPCTKCRMLVRGLFQWTNPTAKTSTPARLGFDYRFIIRHEIHSGLEFYFQTRGLALIVLEGGGKKKRLSQVNFKQKQKKSKRRLIIN